ncbi:pilus assembly protein PilO [Bacillus sp. V3-13]|uniref:pilus assembly protein PilO n=1 Tax=Bacillus sp. V3-13 TaxID=2053728 RepID=UPI000C76E91D|nr:pilus assembly protein PilO [Bacillus sp. V3-13]PLR75505.1 pilus assembly protein PilO [Bacillus sp. V3-13]
MNREVAKKQILITVLVLLLFGGMALGSYYAFLLPLNEQLQRKESDLNLAEGELKIIQKRLEQMDEEPPLSTMELQRRMPVTRMLDQLLLDIERAEIISDTYVKEIRLNGPGSEEEIEPAKTDHNNLADGDEIGEANIETGKSSENPGDGVLPNGVKKTTVVIAGEADTYFEMESFIEVIEGLQRIVKVEQLQFTAPEEIYSVEQTPELLEFELTIAAYYYPGLEDLQEELPPLAAPEVSNKKDPTSRFSEGNTNNDQP